MDEELIRRTELYLARYGLRITEELGDGLHGIVLLVEDNLNGGATALKVHRYAEAYQREVEVYNHLNENGIFKIRGHHVPLLLRKCDELLAIEMTTVRRPFLLDFAGAYLDSDEPQFTLEAWAQWEEDKKEMFGENWAAAKKILQSLRAHGVHMVDVNPGNVGFKLEDL